MVAVSEKLPKLFYHRLFFFFAGKGEKCPHIVIKHFGMLFSNVDHLCYFVTYVILMLYCNMP